MTALRRRFGHVRTEERTIMAQEHAGDSQTGHDRLTAVLATADLASDDDVVTAAHAVLALDACGVQIGDGNFMTLHV